MRVSEAPVQIRLADLLRAIERLSPAEFGVVAERRFTMNAQTDMAEEAVIERGIEALMGALGPHRNRSLSNYVQSPHPGLCGVAS